MRKRLLLILTIGALAGIFLSSLNPVNSKFLKLAFLGCTCFIWVGLTALIWKRKLIRTFTLLVPLVLIFLLLLPAKDIDTEKLRQIYVAQTKKFEGTQYYWGGESPRGIDCSGLPRRALRDALLTYGLKQLNTQALRCYLEHWWFDASAQALGENYRDYTVPLATKGTIRDMDYQKLLPGDMAVTKGGAHILVYLGKHEWIQAAPDIGAVVTLNGRTGDSTWFHMTATTHRWQLVSTKKP